MQYLLLFWAIISGFLFPKASDIASFNGRTNLLVMGIGGIDHTAGDLTDTMIVASTSIEGKSVTLISLPRDLWMPDIRAKINSAYHYGGVEMAKAETQKATGVPIHFTVLIDFSGFVDIVDAIGGIEVNVERSFTDELYPVSGRENDTCGGDKTFKCRYETITFNAGPQIMDGERALKFIRSRHSSGDEGTDTAREARSQKVLDAIKTRILSPQTLLDPFKDVAIINVARGSIKTDIDAKSLSILARSIFRGRNSIKNELIPETLLVNPPISTTYDNQYVFIPKEGNGKWSEINSWVFSILFSQTY
jgi:LCP family protein required for cell wall assembly